jgi:hypothetical protein
LTDIVLGVLNWIKADFRVWPLRFVLEVMAWATSIGCAVTMALTLPNPPFIILYPLFIAQCAVFAWAAWTRQSFGMIGNYILLITIDVFGYVRFLLLDT